MAAFAASREAEPVAAIDGEASGVDPWDQIGPVDW
jgi:hypothetical protein